MDRAALARTIDHTLLRPDAGRDDVLKLCDEALAFGCAAACVHGARVALAAARLAGSAVRVAAVVGFPCGANRSAVKVAEAEAARADGAGELDMVMNLGAFKDGDLALVEREIRAVAALGLPLKVILETGLWSPAEQVRAAQLAAAAGARFVKTSTGFGPGGATVEVVERLAAAVAGAAEVKASGGIRDRATALALLAAGASRLGTSATAAILP